MRKYICHKTEVLVHEYDTQGYALVEEVGSGNVRVVPVSLLSDDCAHYTPNNWV